MQGPLVAGIAYCLNTLILELLNAGTLMFEPPNAGNY